MSKIVEWVLELDVADGKLEELKALAQEMSEATRSDEPGALTYEWYIDAVGSKCHIKERYSDSEAVMVHLRNFGEKFTDRFLSILTPTAITVYGAASVEVLAALGRFAPVHYQLLGGFGR